MSLLRISASVILFAPAVLNAQPPAPLPHGVPAKPGRPAQPPKAESPVQKYAAKMLAAVEKEDEALAKLPRHPVSVGVNLIFAQGGYIKQIPTKDILAAVDALADAGVTRLDVNPSVTFWVGNGDPAAVANYKKVVARVREKGMTLAVNPLNQGVELPVKTLAAYQQLCVEAFPKMAEDLAPDTFVVLHEPSTMARRLGIQGTPAEWAKFADATADALRKAKPKLRVGVGGLGGDRKVIEAILAVKSVDTITLDVYSISSLTGDKQIAAEARKAGKRVNIEETWRPAVEVTPKGVTPRPGAGIADAAFEKVDVEWLKMMHRYAETGPFESVTYFWASCFFLYERGDVNAENLAYQRAAARAAAEGKRTGAYDALKAAAGK